MQLSGIQHTSGCAIRALGFTSMQAGFILLLISQSFTLLYQLALFWSGTICICCGLAVFLGSFLRGGNGWRGF